MKSVNSLVALSLALLLVPVTACAVSDKPVKAPAALKATTQRVEISVTSEGFVAPKTKLKAGQEVTLVVTRKVDRTCATDIVIKEYGVNKPLPVNVPVEVTFTPRKAGAIRYACAMDMIAGELIAE